MMAKDDNGKNAQFRADGYIAGSGEFRAQSPATSIYWTNVPDVSTGDGHGKGLGLTLSQGGSAAISSNNASIGGAIRPMKSNN